MENNISVFDFLKKFPDEDTCEKYILAARFPRGVYCPHCGHHKIYRLETQKRFKCGVCRKQFTVRTGSVLAESKVPLQKWLMTAWIMTSHPKGISSIQLGKTLGVTQKTAWFLAHRIREAFTQNGGLFTGTVEVDETYIGGKEKNKHANKKLHAGRGGVGKVAVVGIKMRDGKVRATPVTDTTSKTLHKLIKDNVVLGATVCTDEHRSYSGLSADYNHLTINHSVGEYVKEMASTNGIESFWSLLKRGFMGTYHQMSPEHLNKYVNEFSFRHDVLKVSCVEILNKVFYNTNGRRVTYKDLKLCPIKQG